MRFSWLFGVLISYIIVTIDGRPEVQTPAPSTQGQVVPKGVKDTDSSPLTAINVTTGDVGSMSGANNSVVVVADVSRPVVDTTLAPLTLVANVSIANTSVADGAAGSSKVLVKPPETPQAPVTIDAVVPPDSPVQVVANVMQNDTIRVVADVGPDVPEVTLVIGHGQMRYYSPWKKASSTTRNMWNVNVRV